MDEVVRIRPIEKIFHRSFSRNVTSLVFIGTNYSIKITYKATRDVRSNVVKIMPKISSVQVTSRIIGNREF